MRFSLTIAFTICAATLVQCAPTTPVDATTLLKNGQAAQALNAEWKNLTATDPCTDADRACVDNSISVCQNKTWNTTAGRCSQGQQCFAIPSVKADGTSITCTSEKNALSLINSTGAKGDTDGAGAGSTTKSQASITASPNDATASASATVERVTVTATVTITPVTTPLPVTIRTISPSEASQLVSSILASHTHTRASASSTQLPETLIPTATTSQNVRTVSPGEASMELSSILAIGQEETASPAAPPATITLVAALPSDTATAIATVSATPAADSASGYGYGGY